jgi:flagellar operon protein
MVAGKIKAGQLQAALQSPARQSGPRVADKQGVAKNTFRDVLAHKLNQDGPRVRFSAHAVERLNARDIALTENELVQLNHAVDKVEEKGGKDALLMLGNLAFVVSVPNRTVVTALEKFSGEDKVFTNIDSALIV